MSFLESNNVQPIRELCTGIALLAVVLGWVGHWLGWSHSISAGLLETGLIAIIAGEVYAKD